MFWLLCPKSLWFLILPCQKNYTEKRTTIHSAMSNHCDLGRFKVVPLIVWPTCLKKNKKSKKRKRRKHQSDSSLAAVETTLPQNLWFFSVFDTLVIPIPESCKCAATRITNYAWEVWRLYFPWKIQKNAWSLKEHIGDTHYLSNNIPQTLKRKIIIVLYGIPEIL